MDQRRYSFIKDIVAPLTVGSLICIGGSYWAALRAVDHLNYNVTTNTSKINAWDSFAAVISAMQTEQARRGEWMANSDKRFEYLERKTDDLPTKSDAQKDQALILEKLKNLEFKLNAISAQR